MATAVVFVAYRTSLDRSSQALNTGWINFAKGSKSDPSCPAANCPNIEELSDGINLENQIVHPLFKGRKSGKRGASRMMEWTQVSKVERIWPKCYGLAMPGGHYLTYYLTTDLITVLLCLVRISG